MKMPNRKNLRRIVTTVLALFLALIMLLPLLTILLPTASGALSVEELEAQISSFSGQLGDYKSQLAQAKANLSAIAGEKSKALQQKRYLDDQIAAISGEISATGQLIELYDQQIAHEEVNLAAAQAREAERYDLFLRRVRAMEEQSAVSYWSILFQADSFSDLLDRVNFVNEVIEYDNGVMDMLAAEREAVAAAKAVLEQTRAEQAEHKASLEVQKAELDNAATQAQALVRQIESKEDEYEAAYDAIRAEMEQVSQELVKKEKELKEAIARNAIQFDPGTGYYWPLPKEYVTVTSVFGPRPHPITGKRHNHTGTDIAAPRNTEIYAARGGVVITSTYNSSYGNYVVVGHDNGISTLYAHMNSRNVKEGDVVKQGQVIGYVGTTGSSTGYHLHFEVRVNGERTEPQNYYPNIKFKYS